MRVLIIAGRCLAAVLGLSALCIVLALAFFNPNARRDEIQAWVTEQTGRSFTLDGELGWQLWPHLVVTLPHTRLGAAPGIHNADDTSLPFAEWQQASMSVRLWPLLRGRLEFGAVQLRGLRVRLQRDAQGRNSWQDLLQLLAEDRPPGRFKFAGLAGVKIDDARISLGDAMTGRMSVVQVVSLQTSPITFDRPIDVELKANLRTQTGVVDEGAGDLHGQSIELPFTLSLQVQADTALQHWQVDDLLLAMQVTASDVLSAGAMINALPVTLRLQHADWQLTQQLLLHTLQVEIGEAQLTTDRLQLTQLHATPQVATVLQLDVPNLRQWLQHLAIDVPATTDATTLRRLSAQLQATGNIQDLRLQVMSLQLDQTRCTGEARIQHRADGSRYSIDWHADQANLDRYLPVTSPPGIGQATASPVPLEWLRSLNVRGQLRIDQVRWQAVRAQGLTIALDGT